MKLGEFTEAQIIALAQEAYEKGDAGFKIVGKKSALIVIDMQEEFVKPHWTPFGFQKPLNKLRELNY
jgi:hypothetical protein